MKTHTFSIGQRVKLTPDVFGSWFKEPVYRITGDGNDNMIAIVLETKRGFHDQGWHDAGLFQLASDAS